MQRPSSTSPPADTKQTALYGSHASASDLQSTVQNVSAATAAPGTGEAGQEQVLERKRKRPYGVSCLVCREKKTACDGVRPRCGGCINSGEECIVPAPQRPLRRNINLTRDQNGQTSSSTASVRYLLQRIRQSEARIRSLEEAIDAKGSVAGSVRLSKPSELRWDEDNNDSADEGDEDFHGSSHRAIEAGGDDGISEGARYQLTLDESGNVIYHGLTGWSQGPQYATPSAQSTTSKPGVPGFADPTFAPFFQALASHKHISVAPDIGDAMLNCFFNYQVFETIHQPLFTRDMALNGPYFSEFLLMAIYGAATRKIDGLNMQDRAVQGDLFMKLAKEYMMKDLEKAPTVPLIQGLLLLSSTQMAEGLVSGGWLHAGMAFRMIVDLGIHLAPEHVQGAKQLSAEDQQMRDRLFWAAFVWDKSISLALGREPTLAPRLGKVPTALADFEDEQDDWSPFYRHPINRPWHLTNYSYPRKRRTMWFRFLASLSLILHEVIMDLYSTESRLNSRQRASVRSRIRGRLDEIWANVPDDAKYASGSVCPSPQVFMFQMLYHATYILVCRTDLSQSDIIAGNREAKVSVCEEHSTKASALAKAFTDTFGERMTYVAVYSLFVAASFDIELLYSPNSNTQANALSRLQQWMDIMDRSGSRVPSIRRSVQHISTSVCTAVARNATLAASESGARILGKHAQQEPQDHGTAAMLSGLPDMPDLGAETGVFDFFDLLGNSQAT